MMQLAPPAIEGLLASTPEPLPFDRSLEIRSFLLQRERGNILIYSNRSLDHDIDAIELAGGAARQYLNHRHEAMFAPGFEPAPLFVHERERAAVSRHLHVRGSYSRRHRLDEDFEVIPTPGHTPGATSFLWESGEHRLLFTGDTIYLRDGQWRAAVLDGSDRAQYAASLELIRDLDFDVLVPWASSAGRPFYALTGPVETGANIGQILDRVGHAESP